MSPSDTLKNKIEEHLKSLKLKVMLEELEHDLHLANQEKWPPIVLLERLLAKESAAFMVRKIERRICESKLPDRKLLQNFDFKFQTGIDQTQIMGLAEMDFVKRKQSLVLGGHSGTGKSHIAKALLLRGCQKGWRCFYTTAADMLRHLKSGLVDGTLEQKMKRYLGPELLLIDEVGFDRLEQDETRPAALFFKVIDGRYAKRSTIFTSNLDFTQLGTYLGDPVITAALVDRLIHHAVIINVKGPSWRLHQSNKLNADTGHSQPE